VDERIQAAFQPQFNSRFPYQFMGYWCHYLDFSIWSPFHPRGLTSALHPTPVREFYPILQIPGSALQFFLHHTQRSPGDQNHQRNE
jgi:hypothetical protein